MVVKNLFILSQGFLLKLHAMFIFIPGKHFHWKNDANCCKLWWWKQIKLAALIDIAGNHQGYITLGNHKHEVHNSTAATSSLLLYIIETLHSANLWLNNVCKKMIEIF